MSERQKLGIETEYSIAKFLRSSPIRIHFPSVHLDVSDRKLFPKLAFEIALERRRFTNPHIQVGLPAVPLPSRHPWNAVIQLMPPQRTFVNDLRESQASLRHNRAERAGVHQYQPTGRIRHSKTRLPARVRVPAAHSLRCDNLPGRPQAAQVPPKSVTSIAPMTNQGTRRPRPIVGAVPLKARTTAGANNATAGTCGKPYRILSSPKALSGKT